MKEYDINQIQAKAAFDAQTQARMRAPNQGGYTPELANLCGPALGLMADMPQEISPLASVIRDLTGGIEILEKAIKRLESKLGPVRWCRPQVDAQKANRPVAGGSDVCACLSARVDHLRHLESEVNRIIEECEV